MTPTTPSPISDQAAGEREALRIDLILTHEQVSALYVTLFHRERPAFGWIEDPLVAIEALLKPAHDAIHDRTFNSMNRQFFGDDRMVFKEAAMPTDVAALSTAPTTGSAPEVAECKSCGASPDSWLCPQSTDKRAKCHFAAPASPAASMLTDDVILSFAPPIMTTLLIDFEIVNFARALLEASMGGDKA